MCVQNIFTSTHTYYFNAREGDVYDTVIIQYHSVSWQEMTQSKQILSTSLQVVKKNEAIFFL